MSHIPYTHKSERVTSKSPPAATLRVRIDPQFHEMTVDMARLLKGAPMNITPETAMQDMMIDLLRGQASVAYETVMQAGLTALFDRPCDRDELTSAMAHFVEQSARRATEAEAALAVAVELNNKRAIEIAALERALARRSDAA